MIIGVMGHSGAGKDTVADYLVSNYNFVKISFADPLKRICKEVFQFSDDQLWGTSEKRNLPDSRYKGLTPRKALQLLGTEWGRTCYEDIWVEYTIRISKEILECEVGYDPKDGSCFGLSRSAKGVVIPDVRFKNEYDAIVKAGGMVIQIIRPGFDGAQAMAAGVENHTSETDMNKLGSSFCLHNVGSKEALYKNLDLIMEPDNDHITT